MSLKKIDTILVSRKWSAKDRLLVLERLALGLKYASKRGFMSGQGLANLSWRIGLLARGQAEKINENEAAVLEGLKVSFQGEE